MEILRAVALAIIAGPALIAQTSWTPYTAQYTQVMTSTNNTTGKTNTQEIQGKRSDQQMDHSSRPSSKMGAPVRGRLWDAKTGQITEINYLTNRGLIVQIVPRTHTSSHPDSAAGTQTIAGLRCVEYPNRPMNSRSTGSGVVCVNEQDDIVMKTQVHDSINNSTVDYTRTITNISFVEPDPDAMKLPAGLQMAKASVHK